VKRTSRLDNQNNNNYAKNNHPSNLNTVHSFHDPQISMNNKAGALVLLPGQTGRTSKMPNMDSAKKQHSTSNDRTGKGRILHTTDAPDATLLPTHSSAATKTVAATEERVENSKTGSRAAHRQLRLRSSSESAETFTFIPELVSERGRQRVRDFVAAYHMLGPAMKAKVDAVNKQLKPFGYSLFQWPETDAGSSLFSKWDIAEL